MALEHDPATCPVCRSEITPDGVRRHFCAHVFWLAWMATCQPAETAAQATRFVSDLEAAYPFLPSSPKEDL
jgi:hypothetical protein